MAKRKAFKFRLYPSSTARHGTEKQEAPGFIHGVCHVFNKLKEIVISAPFTTVGGGIGILALLVTIICMLCTM